MYEIVGTGPQFPKPYSLKAETAEEALNLQEKVANLCGNAAVYDGRGNEVSVAELCKAASREREAARERLRNRNA